MPLDATTNWGVALAGANKKRSAAAEVRDELKAMGYETGLRHVAHLLETNDVRIQSMRVGRLLCSVRQVGENASGKMLWQAGIRFGDRHVKDIGSMNREALADAVYGRADSAKAGRRAA